MVGPSSLGHQTYSTSLNRSVSMIRFLLRTDKGKYLPGRRLVPRINWDRIARSRIEVGTVCWFIETVWEVTDGNSHVLVTSKKLLCTCSYRVKDSNRAWDWP